MLGVACGVMFTLHQPLALARGITRVSDFLVAYTVAALPVRVGLGRLIDRVGAGRAAAASFLLYGVIVAAMPALRGSVGLAVFGAIFGLAHGIFFPALLALSISSAPEAGRSRVIAGFNAAFNVGGAAVIPFGLLAESYGFVAAFVPVGACTMATALGLLAWDAGFGVEAHARVEWGTPRGEGPPIPCPCRSHPKRPNSPANFPVTS